MRERASDKAMDWTGASSRGTAERLPPDVPKQRAALFGRSAFAATTQRDENGAKDALEEDNDRLVADLERKVAALKNATQSIHDEVSDQNRLLSGMVSAASARSGTAFCAPVRHLTPPLPLAAGHRL